MKTLLWGYWEKNLGDDLFLISLLNQSNIRSKDIYLLTHKENKSFYKKLGVHAFCKDSLIYRLINRLSLIIFGVEFFFLCSKNKRFVMLGGSLFAEEKLDKVEKTQLINLSYAVKHAKKSYIIGSNFGPYKSTSFLQNYKNLFRKIDGICFRDEASFNLFRDLKNVKYAPDVVLSGEWEKQIKEVKQEEYDIAISVIDLSQREELLNYQEVYEKFIAKVAKYHSDNNLRVVLLPFCKEQGDDSACSRIKKLCPNNRIDICEYRYIDKFVSIIKNVDLIYATRFHAMILAAYYDKKCIPIVYNIKMINAINSYCDMPEIPIVDIKQLSQVNYRDYLDCEKRFEMKRNIKKDAIKQFDDMKIS